MATANVDLHLHTTLSDGTLPPEEVIALAAEEGLSAVSLTDHDTVRSLARGQAAAARKGLDYLPGTEISLVVRDRSVHLLVYLFDLASPMTAALERLERSRADRLPRLVARLTELGMPLAEDEVRAEAGGELIGRLHFAHALIRKGYVGSVSEAFERWLCRGRPAHLVRDRRTPAEAIALARASGGVTSVAHPGLIDEDEGIALAVIEDLVALGLDGIEVWHPSHADEARRRYAHLARALGLVATGGSDFHGDKKPGLRVGRGRGDLAVPAEVLDALADRRRSREVRS